MLKVLTNFTAKAIVTQVSFLPPLSSVPHANRVSSPRNSSRNGDYASAFYTYLAVFGVLALSHQRLTVLFLVALSLSFDISLMKSYLLTRLI